MAKTKHKPNKGLVKRVKVTASGRIKMRRPGNRHLRSHKDGDLIRSYRRTTLASDPDMKKLRRVLTLKRPRLRYAEKIALSAGVETPAEPVTPASTGRTRKTRAATPREER
jgi:large subunit ribosomal protein L35